MTKDEIFAAILSREGGYVDHPDDRGGPTHWGITLTTARPGLMAIWGICGILPVIKH